MYVESLGPHDFGKVSFVKFGPANQESIGDIHMVSNFLFSVSSYILVLRSRVSSLKGLIENSAFTNLFNYVLPLRFVSF